MFYLRVVNDHA